MKTAILFSGQGAQTVGMGRDLIEKYPTAANLFNKADEVLGCGLRKIILEGPMEELTRSEYAQPAILLMSWTALQLLKELVPDFHFEGTAGLSLGEFTALTAAGTFTFEDAISLVRKRGTYMQEACDATQGGMAAIIALDIEKDREICAETGIELANLNCPGQLVISGPTPQVIKACELARARGAKRALPLAVAGAFHSSLMASAAPKLRTALAQVKMASPSIPVISNVTALPHEQDTAVIAETLIRQVTSSVLFEASLNYLISEGFTRFIELGPGTVLCGFLKRISKEVQILNVSDLPSLEQTVACLQADQS